VPSRGFTPFGRGSAAQCRLLGVPVVVRHTCYLSSPLPPCGDRSGLRPVVGLIRPLLTSAPRSGDLSVTPVPWDTAQISWGKPRSFPRTPAGFTAAAFDGYGLRDWLPARPATPASLSDCCSSGRDFVPHFLQTVPRGSALVFHSCFTSIRLHRGLSPPSCWACPAHSPAPAAHRSAASGLDRDTPGREFGIGAVNDAIGSPPRWSFEGCGRG